MNPSASSKVRWKVPDIKSLVLEEANNNHSLPFIALTETWLKSYISDAQLKIPGYEASRCDRDIRIGGGVLLYSHSSIPISEQLTYDDHTCQVLFCKFDTIKTCILLVYRPPNAPLKSFSGVLAFMNKCIREVNDDSYQFCFLGDFNLPEIQWPSGIVSPGGSSESAESANRLLAFMAENLLNQYVHCPTRKNNTLDLFFTNDDRLVTNVESNDTKLSDHDMVDIMINYNPVCRDSPFSPSFDENSFRSLDFHKADFEKIKTDLQEIDWELLRSLCSFEEFPVLFTDTLMQVCSASVPVKKPPSGRPKHLNALRRKKKRLEARLSAVTQRGNIQQTQFVEDQLALLHYDMKDAICKNLDQKEMKAVNRIKSNPKYFFSYASSLSKVKSSISMLMDESGTVLTDPKTIADSFQQQFSSVFSDPNSPFTEEPDFAEPQITSPCFDESFTLCEEDIVSAIKSIPSDAACGPDGVPAVLLKNCATELAIPLKLLWDESFKIGTVPEFYKQTFVSPLYKKGDRAKAENYRPVALTSHIVKVYERILRQAMVSFIEDNGLLCDHQHGFRTGRSCLTQLLSHFDDIISNLCNGADTDAIYLDFAKAFDKVDHQLLIKKLRRYQFSEHLIAWITSFLTDRSQHVVVNGMSSLVALIISGVPQGSVLGPLLFILFINDMQSCINFSTIRFFADDTRLLKHIYGHSDSEELQKDLDSVIKWAKANNMSLHEDKFEVMIHKHRPHSLLYELPFSICEMTYSVTSGNILYPVEQLKDLGVIVSSDLTWFSHVSSATSRARSMASWVLSAFKTRDRITMITLYKSLVRSHLEYCCPLWNTNKVADIDLIEGVQKSFTSRIWGLQHLNYWERLSSLNLMSLQRRRERYIIIHMWKVYREFVPNDLGIQFMAPSRLGVKAKVPPIVKSSSLRNQSLYDNSFAVVGPRLWNILPSHLHHIAELQQFKIKLTEFINLFPDKPPVSGYCHANSNSLLDWSKNNMAAVQQGRSGTTMTQ